MDELNEQDRKLLELLKQLDRPCKIAFYAMLANECGYPAPRPSGVSNEDCKEAIKALHKRIQDPDAKPQDIDRWRDACRFIWRNWAEGRTGEI